jgi:hypothetical protein
MKNWVIYVWREKTLYRAAVLVKTKHINSIFQSAWRIKLPRLKFQVFRAKTSAINQLQNTLNAIKWYGVKILDKTGNVDHEAFMEEETKSAVRAISRGKDIADVKKLKLKKYKVKDITLEGAKELNL